MLIDEIGSGTDPAEGGALAAAVLTELTRRSCFTVATTHLGELKLLASEERGVVNASLQFDAERLQPTYRLVKGVPGRSLRAGDRPAAGPARGILAAAEQAMPEGERDIGKLLLELEAKEQQPPTPGFRLERELAQTETLRARLERRERGTARAREGRRAPRARAGPGAVAAGAPGGGGGDRRGARRRRRRALHEAARAARRRVEEAANRQSERVPSERRPKTAAPARPAP